MINVPPNVEWYGNRNTHHQGDGALFMNAEGIETEIPHLVFRCSGVIMQSFLGDSDSRHLRMRLIAHKFVM